MIVWKQHKAASKNIEVDMQIIKICLGYYLYQKNVDILPTAYDGAWRKQAPTKHMRAVKANCRLFARPHDPVDLTALFIMRSEINLASDMVAADRISLHPQSGEHVTLQMNNS